jgi:thiamine-monophosphate kinase
VVAAHAGANSMLDISDSLVKDAARISKASKVSLNIEASMLLGYQAILEQAAIRLGVDSLNWILFGGEDHSLLATFSSAETVPKGFKVIGQVVAQTETPVLLDMQPIEEKGWDSVNG